MIHNFANIVFPVVSAGLVPANVRAEAQRPPRGAAAEGGRDAADVRAEGQGEGGRAQGG